MPFCYENVKETNVPMKKVAEKVSEKVSEKVAEKVGFPGI